MQASYLVHYGIKGQKHGIRRFQNEDGTLTEEGKRRYGYYDSLTDKQKKIFDQKMTDRQRDRIMKKLGEGKSWSEGIKEMSDEHRNRMQGLILGSIAAGIMIANPELRSAAKQITKSAGKTLFRAIKNTNIAKRGSLWMKKFMNRRSMMKNGAVVLKKSAYSIRDIPFGGYLSR